MDLFHFLMLGWGDTTQQLSPAPHGRSFQCKWDCDLDTHAGTEIRNWRSEVLLSPFFLFDQSICECSVLLLKFDRKLCVVLCCTVCRKAVFSIKHWDVYRYNYSFNNLWRYLNLLQRMFGECIWNALCVPSSKENCNRVHQNPFGRIRRNDFLSLKSKIGKLWPVISAPILQTGRVITQKSKGSLNFVYSKKYIIKNVLLYSRLYCIFVYLNLFIWCDEKTVLGNFYFQYHIDFVWDSGLSSEQFIWCCFGFAMTATLITHQCFIYFWTVLTQQELLFVLLPNQQGGVDAQESGRGFIQDSQPKQLKGSFHATWHHVQQ